MKIEHLQYHKGVWGTLNAQEATTIPSLVISFLPPSLPNMAGAFEQLRLQYPQAIVIGCTTGGQIQDDDYFDDVAVATLVHFERSTVTLATIKNDNPSTSFQSGAHLAKELNIVGLRGIFILSEGLNVNGSDLIKGLKSALPTNLPISGGLAGDDANFAKTLVGANSPMQSGLIAAVGFYGDHVSLDHSYGGGWQEFGPERTITRSVDNVLYELDGQPALALYKKYLGKEAEQLPSSALLYPLKIWDNDPKTGQVKDVVRTILAVDEESQSMTFAGNIPEGFSAQLMMGTYDNIIQGATEAAQALKPASTNSDQLAILVSCIGRKLMLGQRVYEEVEEVSEALGSGIPQIGFYSYGELCPHLNQGSSELHNQTMTITVLSEK